MVKRILLVVEDTTGSREAVAWTLALARRLEARVIAASVIDPAGDPGIDAEELEERRWKTLYEIEDDAFQADVKISLLLDQGDPLERVLELGASYDADLLVVGAGSQLEPAALLRRGGMPVCFLAESNPAAKEG